MHMVCYNCCINPVVPNKVESFVTFNGIGGA